MIGNFFCSWSGGKDSCLALYKALKQGGTPKFLLTMCIEEGERTRMHGLHVDVILAQADSLGIPSITQNSSWQNYRENYVSKIKEFSHLNLKSGVFGDIDFEVAREWEKILCQDLGLNCFLPLWQQKREDLTKEFINLGFKAYIVAVDAKKLNKIFLGRELTFDIVNEFKNIGIDPSGEGGEYHTVVVDGPIFHRPIQLELGIQVLRSDYWFQDYSLCQKK